MILRPPRAAEPGKAAAADDHREPDEVILGYQWEQRSRGLSANEGRRAEAEDANPKLVPIHNQHLAQDAKIPSKKPRVDDKQAGSKLAKSQRRRSKRDADDDDFIPRNNRRKKSDSL